MRLLGRAIVAALPVPRIEQGRDRGRADGTIRTRNNTSQHAALSREMLLRGPLLGHVAAQCQQNSNSLLVHSAKVQSRRDAAQKVRQGSLRPKS
jgi:hypothetical protein